MRTPSDKIESFAFFSSDELKEKRQTLEIESDAFEIRRRKRKSIYQNGTDKNRPAKAANGES
jgi:hypothetical protein